ncbi:MAG TPA: hypothetical protein VIX58_04025, partial [Anaerolineae bacterium]
MGEMEVKPEAAKRKYLFSFSRPFLLFIFYSALALGSLAFAALSFVNFQRDVRGVESVRRTAPLALGVNTDLEQYQTRDQIRKGLLYVKIAGLTTIRQHFSWRAIETTPGVYDWTKYDQMVEVAGSLNLDILPVLDTTPPFYQRDYERLNPHAPPDDFARFAKFAGDFAARYQFHQYEVWDQPNVYPNWGERNSNPVEYARLLEAASASLRARDPVAEIIIGGLAMNLEKERDKRNYSEVLFLRGLYDAGAAKDFDAVGAKPYGLWTGPEDRRVSLDVLDFSRVILLREEMRVHNDTRPILGVEFGWNALPPDWHGNPSPWGSDTPETQSARTQAAVARVRDEWAWMPSLYAAAFQPNAASDDPRWGLALLNEQGEPTTLYGSFARLNGQALLPGPASNSMLFYLALGVLVAAAVVAGWRASVVAARLPLREMWNAVSQRFNAAPEFAQFAALALAVGAFYFAPHTDLSFVLLLAVLCLFTLRLDLGLVITVFTIPFYLAPKILFSGFALSLNEVLTLVGVGAFVIQKLFQSQT